MYQGIIELQLQLFGVVYCPRSSSAMQMLAVYSYIQRTNKKQHARTEVITKQIRPAAHRAFDEGVELVLYVCPGARCGGVGRRMVAPSSTAALSASLNSLAGVCHPGP